MNRRLLVFHTLTLSFVLLCFYALGTVHPGHAQAQTISPGCNAMNNPGYDTEGLFGRVTDEFWAGDFISVTAGEPSTDIVGGVELWDEYNSIRTQVGGSAYTPPVTFTYTIPNAGTRKIWWQVWGGAAAPTVTWTVFCIPSPFGPPTATPIPTITPTNFVPTATAPVKPTAKPLFDDGRCNQQADQPVTIYSDRKGGYYFYAVYQSVGHFALHLTASDLAANPDKGQNYLIAEAVGVQVYRLKGGKLQVKRLLPDGKSYDFIWPPCH